MKQMKIQQKIQQTKIPQTELVKISIVIICDKIRQEKLERLFCSLGKLPSEVELLLLHESNLLVLPPRLPFPFRYILIPEKHGIPFNRNQGIKEAAGEIIVFIDDDCWVPERWLQHLVEPLKRNKAIMAVTGGTKIPRSNFLGDGVSALGFPGGGSLGFEKVWKVSPEGLTNHLSVGNCALRRKVFEQVGFFDETMKSGAEDTEFSYRLEKARIPVCYVPEAFAYHEARTTWKSFVGWQVRRGRANYQFKAKVGNINGFIKLRLWSAVNIVRENLNWKLPLVLFLLGASFVLQQWGYWQERKKEEQKNKAEKQVKR